MIIDQFEREKRLLVIFPNSSQQIDLMNSTLVNLPQFVQDTTNHAVAVAWPLDISPTCSISIFGIGALVLPRSVLLALGFLT